MAKPIPAPNQKDIKLGWIRGHDLVKEISERTYRSGWEAGMEEVQAVIDELVALGYLDQATS